MTRNLLLCIAGLSLSAAAQAVYVPPADTPLYIKFDNLEQISQTNAIVAPSGATEGNWGVFEVSSIALGSLAADPIFWDPISPPDWVNSAAAEITGIWYGVDNLTAATCGAIGAAICSDTGGYMDIYWDETPDAQLTTSLPSDRTGDAAFTNFTDGTFLIRLVWASGIAAADANVGIVGTAVPSTGGFSGIADSYMNVDTSVVGAWTSVMNGDYFPTAFGQRDIRLRNIYNGRTNWNGDGDVIGAQSSDPLRVFTVPEPSSLLLLGAGMLVASFAGRRAKKG